MKLTDPMRAYLRDPEIALLPFYDLIMAFIREFGLTPEQAGDLVAQWILETA